MRSFVETYRSLFPAVVLDSLRVDGVWRHGWREVEPGAPDAYVHPPAARGGTTEIDYALALPNQQAPYGLPVWMRHRHAVNTGTIFEFLACACCACNPCFEGVEVVGPALPWVDDAGLWDAVDLTGLDGIVTVADGTPAAHQGAAIADVPTGGGATAADNATAINLILARLRAAGLIAT